VSGDSSATSLSFQSSRVIVRRQNKAARITAAAFAQLVVCLAVVATLPGLTPILAVSTLAMLIMLLWARHTANGGRGNAASLDIQQGKVSLNHQHWGDVRAAWVMPNETSTVVEFEQADGDVLSAEFSSAEDGHAAVGAAGIDIRKRAMRVLLGGRWDGIGYGIATVLFVLLQGTPLFLLFIAFASLGKEPSIALAVALLAASMVFGSRILGPTAVTIGSDGVSWKRGFSKGFVAYRDLAVVETWHGNDIMFRKHNGEIILLSHSRKDPARTAGTVSLIQHAMYGAQTSSSDALSILDRNERSIEAWREAMKALFSSAAYRSVAVTRDDLSRTLDDPQSSSERRIGAAMALAAAGDADALTRVRVAAEACADENLRYCLEGVAAGDTDEHALELATQKS
jgi:hypothetical protein